MHYTFYIIQGDKQYTLHRVLYIAQGVINFAGCYMYIHYTRLHWWDGVMCIVQYNWIEGDTED